MAAILSGMLAATPHALHAVEPEQAHYNVVVTLYNAGQWQAALNKIAEREKLDLAPAMRATYLYVRGLAYERGKKTAEARAAYEQLCGKYPAAPESKLARLSLVYIEYAAGRFDAVILHHGKLDSSALRPADQRNAALMYAESLYARKDDRAALSAYQTAVRLGVDAGPLAAKLFDLYVRLGMHAQIVDHSVNGVPGLAAEDVSLARAEALLALKKWADAEAEARRIPNGSKHFPRAAFGLAQALMRQNKLKEAVAPLEVAIAGLKAPPAPPTAYLALAECLLEAGRTADSVKALAGMEKAAQSLPDTERQKLRSQAALLKLRATLPTAKRADLIRTITATRAAAPPDQLPKLLYLRLYALSEEKNADAILATMKDDLPVFQKSDELGPATLIYLGALRDVKKPDEAVKLLDDLTRRKPAAPEALTGRVLLANDALARGDFAAAKLHFEAVANAPRGEERLGKAAYEELHYNRAVVFQKTGQLDQAANILQAVLNRKPEAGLHQQALLLLGQVRAAQEDFPGAAAAWKQALPGVRSDDEANLRDRLARALFRAKDYAGVIEQLGLAAKEKGPTALPREAREIWARSLYHKKNYAESAKVAQGLAEAFPDAPAYAYDAAVAFERAGQLDHAEKWYVVAAQKRGKLPPEAAAALDSNLAALRLKAGAGDLGAARWLAQLQKPADERAFEMAFAAVRKVCNAGKIDAAGRAALQAALQQNTVESPRRYAVGALLVEALAAAGEHVACAKLSSELSTQFAANEKKLDPKSLGATVAMAIIHFQQGEAARQQRDWGEALAAYETVMSVYPYNEWPDAAACGAAECYFALGDDKTAVLKFQEVVRSKEPNAGPWRDRARRRLDELAKGKRK